METWADDISRQPRLQEWGLIGKDWTAPWARFARARRAAKEHDVQRSGATRIDEVVFGKRKVMTLRMY